MDLVGSGDVLDMEEVPAEQQSAFQADFDECLARNPLEIVKSRESAEAFYDALVATSDCVAALGYDVDEPPSREASVESMLSGSIIDPLWSPYGALFTGTGIARDELERVYSECPEPQWGVTG
ncbi:hypothetical protein [Cellulomonas sp. SLBN-39]|uniref:hypothetical protein n=1 Tax=Cellulomonas sp. SLBN-39 TaxID=2768446 RepID=UPI00135A7F58|nr:hypothetical protein [Cellulomonas sp. SLBN-39]